MFMRDIYWFGVIYAIVFVALGLLGLVNSSVFQDQPLDMTLAGMAGGAFFPTLIISIPFYAILRRRRKKIEEKK